MNNTTIPGLQTTAEAVRQLREHMKATRDQSARKIGSDLRQRGMPERLVQLVVKAFTSEARMKEEQLAIGLRCEMSGKPKPSWLDLLDPP